MTSDAQWSSNYSRHGSKGQVDSDGHGRLHGNCRDAEKDSECAAAKHSFSQAGWAKEVAAASKHVRLTLQEKLEVVALLREKVS